MTDCYPPKKRSAVMRAVRSRDTRPEVRLRAMLHRLGCRFRLGKSKLLGAPDIVLPSRRRVVFMHGCFWHGHDCARGARVPKSNREYWLKKIGRNRARDLETVKALRHLGWRVLVVWECEMAPESKLRRRLERFLK